MSEFTILNGMIGAGKYVVAGAFLLLLAIVFIGMGATVLRIVQGPPSAGASETNYRDRPRVVVPILAFLGLSLLLGVYLPAPLRSLLSDAAALVEPLP